MEKPEIGYPCVWPFRVIGNDAESLRGSITEVLSSHSFELGSGNTSSQGRYISLHVEVAVAHEEERNTVFSMLKNVSGVKMVF